MESANYSSDEESDPGEMGEEAATPDVSNEAPEVEDLETEDPEQGIPQDLQNETVADGSDRKAVSEEQGSAPPAANSQQSPLIVPSNKKSDDKDQDGQSDAEEQPSVSVNGGMILAALESLGHWRVRGASLDEIEQYLLSNFPVSRDKTALRAELAIQLEHAVAEGIVQENQNGSFRLSSFREEADHREGQVGSSGQASSGQESARNGRRAHRRRHSSTTSLDSTSSVASYDSVSSGPTLKTPPARRRRTRKTPSKPTRRSARLRTKTRAAAPPRKAPAAKTRARRASSGGRPPSPRSRPKRRRM